MASKRLRVDWERSPPAKTYWKTTTGFFHRGKIRVPRYLKRFASKEQGVADQAICCPEA
jgi:hypothetical protein